MLYQIVDGNIFVGRNMVVKWRLLRFLSLFFVGVEKKCVTFAADFTVDE